MPVKAVQTTTVYKTTDGKIFTTEQKANEYERCWQFKKFCVDEDKAQKDNNGCVAQLMSDIELNLGVDYFVDFVDRWVDRMYQLKILPQVSVDNSERDCSLGTKYDF